MPNFMHRRREQAELDDLMRSLGFAVARAADTTTRPIRPAWYQGLLYGRPAAVTMVGRRILGVNAVGDDVGNRDVSVIVASVILGVVGVEPLGYGIHTVFGELPDPAPAALTTPDHPAAAMPPAVRLAFHRFARGQAEPAARGRSPHARYLRITDRSRLDSYLPPEILQASAVLVMHEIPMSSGWQSRFVPNTNGLGWVAHAIETSASPRLSPFAT